VYLSLILNVDDDALLNFDLVHTYGEIRDLLPSLICQSSELRTKVNLGYLTLTYCLDDIEL
jgi:hypothetical protein